MKVGAVNILKDEKALILSLIFLFLYGMFSGYVNFEQSSDEGTRALEGKLEQIVSESKPEMAFNIFMNNLTSTLLMLVAGITVLVPFMVVFSNGYIFGFILRLMEVEGLGWIDFLKAVALHSIFELPAFFISAVLGSRIGAGLIRAKGRRREELTRRMKEGISVFITLVVPLLILAAIVETFVSFELVLG